MSLPLRTLTNRSRVTFDPSETRVIFAEDWNDLADWVNSFSGISGSLPHNHIFNGDSSGVVQDAGDNFTVNTDFADSVALATQGEDFIEVTVDSVSPFRSYGFGDVSVWGNGSYLYIDDTNEWVGINGSVGNYASFDFSTQNISLGVVSATLFGDKNLTIGFDSEPVARFVSDPVNGLHSFFVGDLLSSDNGTIFAVQDFIARIRADVAGFTFMDIDVGAQLLRFLMSDTASYIAGIQGTDHSFLSGFGNLSGDLYGVYSIDEHAIVGAFQGGNGTMLDVSDADTRFYFSYPGYINFVPEEYATATLAIAGGLQGGDIYALPSAGDNRVLCVV